MAADVQLSVDTFFKDIDTNLPDDDKAIIKNEFNSKFGLEQDTLYKVLNEVYKRGLMGDGESVSRFLSCIAKKTSSEQKMTEIVHKNKASFPKSKAQFIGREEDVKKVKSFLKNPNVPGINLFGESGVGKTTLAEEVSKEFKGFNTLFVDLRDIEDMKTVYYLILSTSGLTNWDYTPEKVYMHLENLSEQTLVIFDNVEQLLKEQKKEEFTNFLQTVIKSKACKSKLLKFILTSQAQVKEPSLKKMFFIEYQVKPLGKEVSKEFISKNGKDFFGISEEIQDKASSELTELCRALPYLLKGVKQLTRENNRTPVQVLDKINTQIEKGVPKEFACISALFDAIPSDQLKQVAVKISILRRPFSVSTSMKIAEIESDIDATSDLEVLVNHKIIKAEEVDGKRKYDTHRLFKDFVKAYLCKEHSNFEDNFRQGEKQFFKHFSGKLTKLAQSLEANFVKTYSKLEQNRANFELTFDISCEKKEIFDQLLHSDDHKQFALMGILFEVLKDSHERRELYAKWAEAAEEQENWLASALMRCWQSIQGGAMEGITCAESVLEMANESINKAQQTARPEQMKEVESLFLHCSGKLKWMQATKLARVQRKNKDAQKNLKEGICDLQQAIAMREEFMGDNTLTCRGLNLIGNCYMELEDPLKAKEFYEKAMEMKKRLVGSEKHWEFPTYYNQMAQVHDMLGRKKEKWKFMFGQKRAKKEYYQAIEWMEKSLKLQEDLDVADTEHTATFHRNFANILIGLKEYDKALKYANKSYEYRRNHLGQHPETVRILYLIGIIHEWSKDREAALQKYEEAFEMEESLPEDNHSVVRQLICDRLIEMYKKLKIKDKRKEILSKIEEKKMKEKDQDMEGEASLLPEQPTEGGLNESVEFVIKVYKSGGYYNHSANGHFLYFPPNTVNEQTDFAVKVCNIHPILSPVQFTETLASRILELASSTVDLQEPITVTLLHSGPGKEHGYETIVRSFNAVEERWEEKEVLKEDLHAPEYCRSHYVQVQLTELRTLAVVTRLITDRFEVTPSGCVVRSSVCNDVTVEFPQGAVDKTFDGKMQLLLLPKDRIAIDDKVVSFPVLFFDGFQDVTFSKPVKIRIPYPRSNIPGDFRLFRMNLSNPDNQRETQWKDITVKVHHDKIDTGIEFSVENFSVFWPFLSETSSKYVLDLVKNCYQYWFNPPNDVSFAAYEKKGITGEEFNLKLTCVALDRQDALTHKMEGKSFTTLVESTGDKPMWLRDKAYTHVEEEHYDRNFYLEFLGEEKECNKQFVVETNRNRILLHFYNSKEKSPDSRLCLLSLRKQSENISDSSEVKEYFGINMDALTDTPEDVALELLKHVKSNEQVNIKQWDAKSIENFYSIVPRSDTFFEDLIKSLKLHAEHIADYLGEGRHLVRKPLKEASDELREKVFDIVARNINGYYREKLAYHLGVSKDFVQECRQKYLGHEQVSQILKQWVEISDSQDCTIERLFNALRHLKVRKAEVELANFTTALCKKK